MLHHAFHKSRSLVFEIPNKLSHSFTLCSLLIFFYSFDSKLLHMNFRNSVNCQNIFGYQLILNNHLKYHINVGLVDSISYLSLNVLKFDRFFFFFLKLNFVFSPKLEIISNLRPLIDHSGELIVKSCRILRSWFVWWIELPFIVFFILLLNSCVILGSGLLPTPQRFLVFHFKPEIIEI